MSTNAEEVAKFGIDTANMFGFWDWVGGRYSMDSAIGLSTMLAIGPDNFRAMLGGFHEMDEHFRTAPFERNLPVLMGLLAVWYNNFFGAQTVAVLPYEQYLKRFPAYLQQLTMESNGKHVTLDGEPCQLRHRPDLLGRARHQRPALVLPAHSPGNPAHPLRLHRLCTRRSIRSGEHHDMLLANVFAQAEALAFGKTADEVKAEGTPDWLVPHRVFEGNRPSNTILAGAADACSARQARRALRAQRLHAGRDLGHRFVRPVGRRARQGAGAAHHPGTRRAKPNPSSATTARPTH